MFSYNISSAKADINGGSTYPNIKGQVYFKETKDGVIVTACPHPLHVGDLPPLLENNGYAYMSVLTNKFKISDIIGKTVIIHDMPDDSTTQPSGNSGKKIACGVIRKGF